MNILSDYFNMSILKAVVIIIYHNGEKSETHPRCGSMAAPPIKINIPMFFLPYPEVDDTNFLP
jgi:hypothetical protein